MRNTAIFALGFILLIGFSAPAAAQTAPAPAAKPGGAKAPAPAKKKTPAPAEKKAPTPAPAAKKAPTPAEKKTPAPAEKKTPAPAEKKTPAPAEKKAPAPADNKAPDVPGGAPKAPGAKNGEAGGGGPAAAGGGGQKPAPGGEAKAGGAAARPARKEVEYLDIAPLASEKGVNLEDFVRTMTGLLDIKLTFDPKMLVARKVIIVGNVRSPIPGKPKSKLGFWVPRQALPSIFRAVLRVNNLGLEKVLQRTNEYEIDLQQIIPSAKLKEGNTVVVIGDDAGDIPQGVNFVTMVMHMKYADPQLVFRAITNLLSRPDGFAQPVAGVNAILISDYANNIKRMASIINLIDKAPIPRDIEYIEVYNRPVEEIMDPLQQFLGIGTNRRSPTQAGRQPSEDDQIDLLADSRTNMIMVYGTKTGIERVQHIVEKLDTKVEGVENRRIHVYFAKNVDALELADTLNEVISGVQQGAPQGEATVRSRAPAPVRPPGGGATGISANAAGLADANVSVIPDEVTNSLIITASPEDYRDFLEVIKQLDIRKPQVLIEAIIVEVLSTDDLSLGIEVATLDEPSKRARGFAATSFGLSQLVDQNGTPVDSGGASLSGRAPNQANGVTAGVFKDTFFQIPVLLQAQATVSYTNVLSVPKVLTDSGEEATIEIAREVPVREEVSTNVGDTRNNIRFEDAPITLQVRPLVSKENLRLELNIQVTDFVGAGGGGLPPARNNRTIQQVVTVPNNRLVILGGLTSSRELEQISKVPLLGDIPLLGELFKFRTKQAERRNLYIFLTPRILRENSEVARATADNKTDLMKKTLPLKEDITNALKESDAGRYFQRRGSVPHQRYDYLGTGPAKE